MKIQEIKRLAETYSAEQLRKAEEALLEGNALPFEVTGDDEGEQLTHILAAITICEDVLNHGTELRTAIRNYTQRVRNSIS